MDDDIEDVTNGVLDDGEEREPGMALFKKRTVGKPGEWYYCLEHGKVEEGPECPAKDRFGPYTSRQEAEHAMETAKERNTEWENDPKWHDRPGGGS